MRCDFWNLSCVEIFLKIRVCVSCSFHPEFCFSFHTSAAPYGLQLFEMLYVPGLCFSLCIRPTPNWQRPAACLLDWTGSMWNMNPEPLPECALDNHMITLSSGRECMWANGQRNHFRQITFSDVSLSGLRTTNLVHLKLHVNTKNSIIRLCHV